MKRILFALFFIPVILSAQSQRQTVYQTSPICTVEGFIPLQGGGNLLAGYSRYGADSSLMNLVFLNDSDVTVSHKEFNTATHFDIMSCIVDAGNGFLIGGKSSDTNFFHPQVIKTDLNGNVTWAKYFNNTSFWHGQIIRIIPNGNNFSMYTYAETPTNDFFRIEADAGGNVSAGFQSTANGSVSFKVLDAEAMPGSSSHILSGHCNFNTSTTRGGMLMKTNPLGVQWFKHITAAGNFKNDIVDVAAGTDGFSYSLFVCENMPGNQYSTIVLRMDSSGNLIWAKQLAITNATVNGCSIIESNSHDFFIATYDNVLNAYITKISSSGNVAWSRKWLPSSAGGATALKLFKDVSGNIVFTGMLGNSYFVARLDADATGCSFANSSSINVSNANPTLTDILFTSIPFTGTAVSEPVNYSFLAYGESMICGGVGIDDIENENVLHVFPNPVNEKLYVNSSMPAGIDGEISIYNVTGEKIYSGVYHEKMDVDCRNFQPGIYFLRITEGEKIYSGKFIKE
jgi:hypothetical protein